MNNLKKCLLQESAKMGFEDPQERILVLTENNESIALRKTKNNGERADKIITVDDFFNMIIHSDINNLNISLKNLLILELPHCQLTEVPITFENLNLKHLTLSHNKLTSIPACIYSGLKKLEYLDLGHNSLQIFDIPPGCVFNIKTLKLGHNLLENIPKWIGNFQSINLEELNFSFNKALRYVYSKNSYNMHLMKLKKFKLCNSHLIDADFTFLKCFSKLEYLDLSNKDSKFLNIFSEIDNLFIKLKWKQLKVLKICNLSLPLFPEGVLWIESLTELRISKNFISWFPHGIEFMVNLQILDVSENNLISIPEKLEKLELLETLLASHNSIEVCPDFSNMPHLKILDLYDNLLDSVLLNCDTLEGFDVDQNYFDIDYANYEPKKQKLRENFLKQELRANSRKIRSEIDSSDDKASDSEEEKGFYDATSINKTIIDETEDWDSPAEIGAKNSDIDSIDDAWDGEEKYFRLKPECRKKIYVEDEDWMFEDVEEYSF